MFSNLRLCGGFGRGRSESGDQVHGDQPGAAGRAWAAAMAAGGARDVTGSFITALACGLFALTAYASGVLISQLSTSARSGTAPGCSVQFSSGLAGLYLLTNVSDELGPVGVVRFVSPFHYFNPLLQRLPCAGPRPRS